jgi:hypothetical protein
MVELLNEAARQTNDAGILAMMANNGLTPGAPPPALIAPAPTTNSDKSTVNAGTETKNGR